MSHSKYSPSSLPRLFKCQKSHSMSEGEPNLGSAAATEGTLAHSVLESLLQNESMPKCPDDMGDIMEVIAMQVEERAGDNTIHAELRVQPGVDGTDGTADVVIEGKDDLIVLDLKYGRVPVPPDSPQLMAYLLGAYKKFGVRKNMAVGVIAPRQDVTWSEITVTEEELLAFEANLKTVIESVESGDAVAVHGSGCRWCLAAYKCKAHLNACVTAGLPDPNEVQAWEFQKYYEGLKEASTRFTQYKEALKQRSLDGDMPPGFKLVKGRGSRRACAIDLDAFAAAYDVDVQTYRTVPAIEKLCDTAGKKALADITITSEGSPRIALKSEPGKAYTSHLDDELFPE